MEDHYRPRCQMRAEQHGNPVIIERDDSATTKRKRGIREVTRWFGAA